MTSLSATLTPDSSAGFSLAVRFAAVRDTTESLVAPLTPEDQMVQSMSDASPAKWHLAHTTWFFETFLLKPFARNYRPFDERFAFLFNSYYKQLDEGHPNRATRGTFSRPTLMEVKDYRRHVNEAMHGLVESDHGAAQEIATMTELGLNHEQQHQELIVTDVKHAFWMNPLRPAYMRAEASSTQAVPPLRWLSFPEGL